MLVEVSLMLFWVTPRRALTASFCLVSSPAIVWRRLVCPSSVYPSEAAMDKADKYLGSLARAPASSLGNPSGSGLFDLLGSGAGGAGGGLEGLASLGTGKGGIGGMAGMLDTMDTGNGAGLGMAGLMNAMMGGGGAAGGVGAAGGGGPLAGGLDKKQMLKAAKKMSKVEAVVSLGCGAFPVLQKPVSMGWSRVSMDVWAGGMLAFFGEGAVIRVTGFRGCGGDRVEALVSLGYDAFQILQTPLP